MLSAFVLHAAAGGTDRSFNRRRGSRGRVGAGQVLNGSVVEVAGMDWSNWKPGPALGIDGVGLDV